MAKINTLNNEIIVTNEYRPYDFRRLYIIITEIARKHRDIVLNFKKCTTAFASSMLPICVLSKILRNQGHSFELVLPSDIETPNTSRLFVNTGWASIIDPSHQQSNSHIFGRVPALAFDSPAGQHTVVERMIDGIMRNVTGFSRKDLSAIEWALSEITDNVLVHSQSSVGGIAQLSIFRKNKIIEYSVCDMGLGIPGTLRDAYDYINSDTEALDQAIREGVTRDKNIGQGNGLYGSYQISRISGGYFHIYSGQAGLDYDKFSDLPRLSTETIPFNGTLIVAGINYSTSDVLAKALNFQNQPYEPMDTLEYRYEKKDSDDIVLTVREQVSSLGSRQAGREFQMKLRNFLSLARQQRVVLDFHGIELLSSSFADEVFGKLCKEFGSIHFFRTLHFRHANDPPPKFDPGIM